MRQKVAIALALARHVPVLLLDEPTSGLDPLATMEFSRLLGKLRDRGVAILMVTHDVEEAVYLSDRVVVMALGGGHIIADVRIEMERPRHRRSEVYHRYKDDLMEALEEAMGPAGEGTRGSFA